MKRYNYLIVGAGLAGSTLAERLANTRGASVLVIDRRDHVAGNAHDAAYIDGLQYHKYGPHIFHTNSQLVVDYLSQFTAWRPYEHRVLSRLDGKLVPVPINRTTINELFDLQLDEAGAERFIKERGEPYDRIDNSEQMIRSRIGNDLYERFFRGYTRKQWGRDPSELDASVCGRIPTRSNDDDRYFTDTFQAMPANGYTAMVTRMLESPNIDIRLGVDFRAIVDEVDADHVVFTGPIDEYYDHRFGHLPYRTLDFEFEVHDVPRYQSAACINEPSESVPFTRTTEYPYLTGQTAQKTIISREYPGSVGDPYYPIPCEESRELYRQYAALAR